MGDLRVLFLSINAINKKVDCFFSGAAQMEMCLLLDERE
jgi:hypothetical protein